MGAGEPHLQPGLPSKEYRESRKAPSVGITTGDITHPPSWKAPPSPAPTVLSCSVEPSNALLLTPTDTGPARPRSPQVPTPPGAPHPLSPHFPQKARGTRGYTHVQSPGGPASETAPPLLISTTSSGEGLAVPAEHPHLRPQHSPPPHLLDRSLHSQGLQGSGDLLGLPHLHVHSHSGRLPQRHPAQPKSASERKKGKSR